MNYANTPAAQGLKMPVLVKTSPPGAVVTLNGEAAGTTPATLFYNPFNRLSLSIAKEGFRSAQLGAETTPSSTSRRTGWSPSAWRGSPPGWSMPGPRWSALPSSGAATSTWERGEAGSSVSTSPGGPSPGATTSRMAGTSRRASVNTGTSSSSAPSMARSTGWSPRPGGRPSAWCPSRRPVPSVSLLGGTQDGMLAVNCGGAGMAAVNAAAAAVAGAGARRPRCSDPPSSRGAPSCS